MPVRFVVSRAGGGKTAHCLDAVRDALRASATEGPRLVLLVPEQAALQTERAIIETPDIGGYSRCEVLSFRRLAFRVLSETGSGGRQEVSTLSRLMVLRYLLGRRRAARGGLPVFGSVCDRGGFVRQLADQLGELFYQGVTPEDLEAMIAERGEEDRTFAAKLSEVCRLYRDYLDYLADGRIDADQYLDLAAEKLDDTGWLRGAHVWVDGFAIFSRQEERLLVQLATLAAQVEITLLADPGSAWLTGQAAAGEPTGLFAQIEQTFSRLRQALAGAAVPLEAPLELTPKVPPRFARAPALTQLEQRLFREPPADRRVDTADSDAPVRIIEAATRRVEVNTAVAEIQRLVQRPSDPLRYRDIAIIVREMDAYHDLLSATLEAHEIPYFIDRRRPVAHHPLVELVRTVPQLCADNLAVAPVRILLKTGLTGLDHDEADRLENYVLAHGVRSRKVWLGESWTFRRRLSGRRTDDEPSEAEHVALDEVNRGRERFITPLRPLLEMSAGGARESGRAWATAIFDYFEALSIPDRLETWARQAEADGRLDEAEEHRQVWRDTAALADAFVAALGDEAMSIRQFGEVLDIGLGQFTLGLAPPSLDQVLVGSIERSRHPDIRAALVLGFNEGMFPSISNERGVFSERENEMLRAHGLRLGRGKAMALDTERLLAYISVTRPRDLLRLSYAAADEESKALAPSPYLPFVLGALDDVVVETLNDPADSRSTWSVGTAGELSGLLTLELARRDPLAVEHDPDARGRWNALYEWARGASGCPGALRRATSSFLRADETTLDSPAVHSLHGGDRPWSVSQLEAAAACPFRHFARYGLRLSEREEFKLEAVDLGRLHHAILEELLNGLIADGKRLADVDDEELSKRVAAAAETQSSKLADELAIEHARQEYLHGRSARDLRRAAAAQARAGAAGRFRPAATEVPFGFPDRTGSLPALEIDTPGGRHARLRGFVDRIDVAEDAAGVLGMIVDYKRSGNRPLNLSRVLAGLELQLLSYLLVLREHGARLPGGPTTPAGAFYFNIKPQYESVAHPSEARETKGGVAQSYRPRGVLMTEHVEALDTALAKSGRSAIYNVGIRKDGGLSNAGRSDAVEPEQFDALLALARNQLGTFVDQILDGQIAAKPYHLGNDSLPCNWCPYLNACRFEPITGPKRIIEKLSRADALESLHRRL